MRNVSEEDNSYRDYQKPTQSGDQKVAKPPKHFKFHPEVRSNIYIEDEEMKEIGALGLHQKSMSCIPFEQEDQPIKVKFDAKHHFTNEHQRRKVSPVISQGR